MVAARSVAHGSAHEATGSAQIVKLIAVAVERAGIPRERFLEATGLALGALDAPDGRLRASEIFACAEVAFELTRDPALGLHWAEWLTASSFAPMSQLVAHAGTLREIFAIFFQFGQLVSDEMPLQLVEHGDEAELRFAGVACSSPRLQRMTCEMSMAGLFRMIRDLCPRAVVRCVRFPYPAPEYAPEYARIFEARELFDQACACLVIERATLDLPLLHHDIEIQSQLRPLAERRLSGLRKGGDYAPRVRKLLLLHDAPYRVPLSAIARQLELSVRSLHRRLAAEGQSYRTLASEVSAAVARRLLCDRRRTIQEIAFAMGFAEPSSFHRAFKRWTGTTPTKFRAQRGADGAAGAGP